MHPLPTRLSVYHCYNSVSQSIAIDSIDNITQRDTNVTATIIDNKTIYLIMELFIN